MSFNNSMYSNPKNIGSFLFTENNKNKESLLPPLRDSSQRGVHSNFFPGKPNQETQTIPQFPPQENNSLYLNRSTTSQRSARPLKIENLSQSASPGWITVFGFVPSSASEVFEHFSQVGIIDKHISVVGANWFHIKYYEHSCSAKALSLHGQILNLPHIKVMLGVKETKDSEIYDYEYEANNSFQMMGTNRRLPFDLVNITSLVPSQPRTLQDSAYDFINLFLGW